MHSISAHEHMMSTWEHEYMSTSSQRIGMCKVHSQACDLWWGCIPESPVPDVLRAYSKLTGGLQCVEDTMQAACK